MRGADYTELDDAIVDAVQRGVGSFTHLSGVHAVRNAAKTLAMASPKDRRGEHRPVWRFVDSRLQALRKKGVITYSRSAGWSVT